MIKKKITISSELRNNETKLMKLLDMTYQDRSCQTCYAQEKEKKVNIFSLFPTCAYTLQMAKFKLG